MELSFEQFKEMKAFECFEFIEDDYIRENAIKAAYEATKRTLLRERENENTLNKWKRYKSFNAHFVWNLTPVKRVRDCTTFWSALSSILELPEKRERWLQNLERTYRVD